MSSFPGTWIDREPGAGMRMSRTSAKCVVQAVRGGWLLFSSVGGGKRYTRKRKALHVRIRPRTRIDPALLVLMLVCNQM